MVSGFICFAVVAMRSVMVHLQFRVNTILVSYVITYGAKLLSADWLRHKAFFLNQEGSFGNQEGMVT